MSTSPAIVVCRTIKGVQLDIRAKPGTALMNEATGAVIYTPAKGQALLRDKLSNGERYIHGAEDIDPLIRLAVTHYQFEAIHPFIDGNGRTGRVLNLPYLVDKGLLDISVLYLRRYIIGKKRASFRSGTCSIRPRSASGGIYRRSIIRELAEVIFVNPYCRIGDQVAADIAKLQSASVYLKYLVELGRLEEIKSAGKPLYQSDAACSSQRSSPTKLNR